MAKKNTRTGEDRWWLVLRDLQHNWTRLAPHLAFPTREHPGEKRGRPRLGGLDKCAEAFLYAAYHDLPLRVRAGPAYPTPAPLIRAVSHWIENGCLEAFWKAYVRLADNDCVAAWHEALNAETPLSFQHTWTPRQVAIRRHSYWHVTMRLVVRAAMKQRHIEC